MGVTTDARILKTDGPKSLKIEHPDAFFFSFRIKKKKFTIFYLEAEKKTKKDLYKLILFPFDDFLSEEQKQGSFAEI